MTLEEITIRNKSILDEYINSVSKVEITAFSATHKEKAEFDQKLKNREYSLPQVAINLATAAGFKPFLEYGSLIVNCINKITENEGVKKLGFKKDESLDYSKWLERVKQTKTEGVWIELYDSLIAIVVLTHEARLAVKKEEWQKNNSILKNK